MERAALVDNTGVPSVRLTDGTDQFRSPWAGREGKRRDEEAVEGGGLMFRGEMLLRTQRAADFAS